MKLSFFQSNKSEWGNLQIELSDAISFFLKCKKDFEVEFKEMDKSKTYEQTKGIHLLCQKLAGRLSESNGIKYNLASAKLWVKWNFDFTQLVSEEKAIAEAINERYKSKQSGKEMTRKQFLNLIESFKTSLKEPRSFASATKEEMIELIEKIEELGRKMNWDEIQLTNHEKQQMLNYYQRKES